MLITMKSLGFPKKRFVFICERFVAGKRVLFVALPPSSGQYPEGQHVRGPLRQFW